jgi:hypothetical protein
MSAVQEQRIDVAYPPEDTSWAIVEVMGQASFAGQLAYQQLGGELFIEVIVPETRPKWWYAVPSHGRMFSVRNAVFAIHPCTEEHARAKANAIAAQPPGFVAPKRPVPPVPEVGQRIAIEGYDHDHGATVDAVEETGFWYHEPGEQPRQYRFDLPSWRREGREIQAADGTRLWPGPEYPDAAVSWEPKAAKDDEEIPF